MRRSSDGCRTKLWAGVALATLISVPAHAQTTAAQAVGEQSPPPTTDTEVAADDSTDVVVTGKRFIDLDTTGATKLPLPIEDVPQSISVLNKDFVEVTNARTIGTLADYAVGVTQQGTFYGTYSAVKSRGFTLRESYGYRVNSNLFTYYYDFDPAIIDRTEFVRGPSSVVYGISNPGGLVNFVLKDPRSTFGGEVQASYGSWDTKRLQAEVTGPLDEQGSLRALLVGAVEDADSQVDFVKRTNIAAYGVLRLDAGNLQLTARGGHIDREAVTFDGFPIFNDGSVPRVPRSLYLGSPRDNYLNTKATFGIGEATYANGPFRASAVVSYQDIRNKLGLVYPFGLSPAGDTRLFGFRAEQPIKVLNTELQLQYDFSLFGRSGSTILASIGYNEIDDRTRVGLAGFSGGPPFRATNIFRPQEQIIADIGRANYGSFFIPDKDLSKQLVGTVQLLLKPAERLTLLLGAAHNDSESTINDTKFDFDAETTLRIGATYEVADDVNLYASFSQSFLPQSIVDVNFQPLAPLEGEQYEAGVKAKLFNGGLLVTAAAFQITQTNAGELIPNTVPEQYQAIGEVRHRGLEFEAIGKIGKRLSVFAGLDVLDPEITKSGNPAEVGRTRPYIPRFNASTFITYTVDLGPRSGLTLGGGVTHTGAQKTAITPGNRSLDNFTLVDAVAEYGFDGFAIRLNVNNLLDERYVLSTYNSTALGHHYGRERNVLVTLLKRW